MRKRHPAVSPVPAVFLAVVLLLCCLPLPAAATSYTVEEVPNVHLTDTTRYLSDPEGLITDADAAAVNLDAAEMETHRGVQMAVVVVPEISGFPDAEAFAKALFLHWDMGNRYSDCGLLILLVTGGHGPAIAVETGQGLKRRLPDEGIYARILQEHMLPYVRKDDFSAGLRKGVEALHKYLRVNEKALPKSGGKAVPAAEAKTDWDEFWVENGENITLLGLLGVAGIVVYLLLVAPGRSRSRSAASKEKEIDAASEYHDPDDDEDGTDSGQKRGGE